MEQVTNLLDVWNLYRQHIKSTCEPAQAENLLSETQSTIMRFLLPGLNCGSKPRGKKMTKAEVETAEESMKTLGVDKLLEAEGAIEKGFKKLKASKASQNTYKSRLLRLLEWCKQQHWWPKSSSKEDSNPYSPKINQGYGKASNNRLTDRDFRYTSYQLQPEEISTSLATELDNLYHFLTDFEWPGRVTERVSISTANTYLKHTRLLLGWLHRYQQVPLEELSLSSLVPLITDEDLDELNSQQKNELWREKKNYLETWLCNYFDFLEKDLKAYSPKTKKFKMNTLTSVGKFLYYQQVETQNDYQKLPILGVISEYSRRVRQEIKIWEQQKRYVVDLDKKWPNIIEGKTALTSIREQILEPLRLQCRPKYQNWHQREKFPIAVSLMHFLAWFFLAGMPARRQEEHRSLKIALSCPVSRPVDIPPDGFIHPLPPNEVRSKSYDGRLEDNYLYKTYSYKGKFYSQGIWVLDIQKYKTHKQYGCQSIIIKNRQFDDGNCLYDYFERYLYGWWQPKLNKNLPVYDWWIKEFVGQTGQWLTSGRSEFQPDDTYYIGNPSEEAFWSWGYFFIMPRVGLPYNSSDYKAFIAIAAHQQTGKRVTPHIMRYVWATWSYQVGLTDQQRESLAYAMGHDVETLQQLYEQCSPDEKRRPIEEAIDQLLFDEISPGLQDEPVVDLDKLAKNLQRLSPDVCQSLLLDVFHVSEKQILLKKEPKNLLEVYEIYTQFVKNTHDSKRAKNIVNETWPTLVNSVLVGLGYSKLPSGTKMSIDEVQNALEFMKTQKVEKLLEARQAQKLGFEKVQRSPKMRKIYTTKLEQFLTWCQQQSWWPGTPSDPDYHENLCCPKSLLSERGKRKNQPLINRRGRTLPYGLKPEEISSSLQAEIDELTKFLTEPRYPGRLIEKIEPDTTKHYLHSILLILGWFYRYQNVPLEKLTLSLLIPQITYQELEKLTEKQCEKLWKQKAQELEKWLCNYFKFIREVVQAESPRTRRSRITALSALGKFQYRHEVEYIKDYANIPLLKVIDKYGHQVSLEVGEWQRNKRYVTDQEKKWPVAEGKTALSVVREQILEPLRLECRPKSFLGKLRKGSGIAISHQHYLIWSFLADMPARRQQEYRELKISLCCPIERPKDVPANGLYHPLPPNKVREKRHDDSLQDNYLYKTYSYQGKHYKDGVWVLDIRDHKQFKEYGPQSILIKNRFFADGRSFYDHLEHYLYGWWLAGGRKNQQIYDWWQQDLRGKRGRWVTLGRAEFEPKDFYCTEEEWAWGYLFIKERMGTPFINTEFAALVENPAFVLIGKRITPHTLRYMWASWAYQVGLTDQQKESLAYAMGHSVKTLKGMYERCTPEEKRRPIEEVVDELLFNEVSSPEPMETMIDSQILKSQLQKLTKAQARRLLKMLKISTGNFIIDE